MLIAGQTPEENFRTLHAAGCIQTLCDVHENVEDAFKAGFERFAFVMYMTRLNPCEGCPQLWNGGQCQVNKQFDDSKITKRKVNAARIKDATTANNGIGSLSVKQIAEQYGVSKSVVRRLKVQGKLDPETLKKLSEEQCSSSS